MSNRAAIVAGRFYPGDKAALRNVVETFLAGNGDSTEKKAAWAVMLPHAGYMYCGDVIGKTLASVQLPKRLIVLSPNHTGFGTPFSVWPDGEWLTPLGAMPVDSGLAAEIIATGSGFQADFQAHLREHSIETLLPFLQIAVAGARIVPVTIGTQNLQALKRAAAGLASVLSRPENRDVGIIVSSDMNHYENAELTLQKDGLALEQIRAMNPEKLLATVAANNISMCGAAPMALTLLTARLLGNYKAEVGAHGTSGAASGDYSQVVGYAGVRILPASSQAS